MKKHFWLIISSLLAGTVIGLIIINITLTTVVVEQINLNKDLKIEIKSKDQQIDGLTKQLDRTQYQLKKVSEESADKTARIAEMTNNGG